MVEIQKSLNQLSANRFRRAVFPTAEDPIRTILIMQSQFRCISMIFAYLQSLYTISNMLINSDIYLCSAFQSKIIPLSQQIKLSLVPRNLERTSNYTFMYCDIVQLQSNYGSQTTHKTRIIENSIPNLETKIIQQFEGQYTSWGFCNDYLLLLNREGDFLLYNMLSKNVFQAQKQHPGLYSDAFIMHTDQHFITCGGCVKNIITGNPQRIIKVWSIDNADGLVQSTRINTGHKKTIQQSFLMNKQHVVSLSTDKSMRFTNISTGEIDNIIRTEFDLISGTQIDFNTVLAGGQSRRLQGFDRRLNRKISNIKVQIPGQIVQICKIKRFNDNFVIIANINEIYALDIRNWKIISLGQYEGQRISEFLTLNQSQFVIGNCQKTLQIWKAN